MGYIGGSGESENNEQNTKTQPVSVGEKIFERKTVNLVTAYQELNVIIFQV